jgi:mono/diheme cytochrome c family protein
MAEVVSNLSSISDSDIHAIATYMASVFGAPSPERQRRGEEVLAQVQSPPQPEKTDAAGEAIYAGACATCHEINRPLPYGGVNLALSTAISAPDARNAANIVLSGVRPIEGERSPIMPGFADSMSDAQIATLLNYLRARFSKGPAWTGVEKTIEDARRTQTVFLQTSPGANNAPAEAAQRDKP